MTKSERKHAELFFKPRADGMATTGHDRVERIAKGAGQPKNTVYGLLGRFFAMQKVMKQIGGGPGGAGMGLLSRLPGFRQLAQLKALKGMDPSEMAGMFGLPEAGAALPAAGGKGSHAAAMARARLMGFGGAPAKVISDEEKKRLRDKKKAERQNKKKARKKR